MCPWWRQVIGFVLLAISAVLAWWAVDVLLHEDRTMAIHRLNDEAERYASTLFFEKMNALAQVCIGLVGAAWAFLTLSDTKVRITGAETVMCFAAANISLVISVVVYHVGYDFIVGRIFHHKAFDIDAPFVTKVNSLQQLTFLFGIVCLGLAAIFGSRKS